LRTPRRYNDIMNIDREVFSDQTTRSFVTAVPVYTDQCERRSEAVKASKYPPTLPNTEDGLSVGLSFFGWQATPPLHPREGG